MNEAVEYFKSITGAKDDIAKRYLGFTENNPELAIQLFFDSPDLALDSNIPAASQPQPAIDSSKRHVDIIDLDPDETIDADNDVVRKSNAISEGTPMTDNDESIARMMQAEVYGEDVFNNNSEADNIRAPIERRREVLVGDVGGDWLEDNLRTSDLHRISAVENYNTRNSEVSSQISMPSIWDLTTDSTSRWRAVSQENATANHRNPKAARLAELFRPPFEMMRQVPWEVARNQGKEERKWIMVNVQDQSIFDCQQLNRDIWKHPGIREAITEHFIFVQYSNDDPRGSQYMHYYFQDRRNSSAYPHIAIVDPRTGEQMKTWSGRPAPQASDFLMQIYEFLDRYSLDTTKKNPVVAQNTENPKNNFFDEMSDQQMLNYGLQHSLANQHDSIPIDADKGKGKEVAEDSGDLDDLTQEADYLVSLFDQISATDPYVEPTVGPRTTRIQFKHAGGRVVKIFNVDDRVQRIYEWLKSDPVHSRPGVEFELKGMGMNLITHLNETIEECGLKNGTVMIEFLETDE